MEFPAALGRDLVKRWRTRAAPVAASGDTPTQAGIRLFEQVHPGTAVNVLSFVAAAPGPVDADRLRSALAEVAARHPHLGPGAPLEVLRADGREAALAQARERAGRPVDLATGPLWRAAVWSAAGETVIQVVAHHLVCDGWSLGVFLAELSAAYSGAPLPPAEPLPATTTEVTDADLAYWRDRLAGAAPPALPTDRPRPARPRFRSGSVPLALGADVARRVREVAAAEGVTPFMLLLSALHLVVAKVSGQSDVVVGSPTITRERHRAPRAIGPLVNMLALRTDSSGARTGRELVRAVRETCLGAYGRGHVPLEAVGGGAIRVMCVLQDGVPEFRLGDLPVRPLLMAPAAIQHDVELYLWLTPEGVTGFLGYDTDLFDASTAGLLADRFGVALGALLADLDVELAGLDVRTSGERAQLALLGAGSAASVPAACVHELVEAQVDRTPDAVALRAVDTTLTYRELDARANRLAHQLIEWGITPGTLVGVRLPRTSDLVVALLGILKAGAAYVPIDPAYPAERVEYIRQDTNAPLILTTDNFAMSNVDIRPAVAVGVEDLAYTIYTSGSTGRPKGVMIEHRQTAAMLDWAVKTFSADVLAETLAATSICFDLSVYEIFAPLTSGATVTLAPNNALDLPCTPCTTCTAPARTPPTAPTR
ncbi:AMP-binding protein [Saccharothrix syringae]|uniref:AMP-binding protein n=1 Tax=Saccharothrix syringae TaxID=103733 RepID=UPI0005278E85|nr:AMP-binding protein [Saccharothrix syringae]